MQFMSALKEQAARETEVYYKFMSSIIKVKAYFMSEIAVLNALVPAPGIIVYVPLELLEAKSILAKKTNIISYIGHPSTAKILSELAGREVPVNRAEYVPKDEDIVLVVRLKKRLPQPSEAEVKPEDLEFALVHYALVH
jgi:hypothetical protein